MKVFEKKSELFNNFIEELWKVWEDRNITLEELSHLLKLVSKDIIPYTKPESAKSILNSLNAIASEVNTQENTANKKHMQTHIYAIINTLSDEIGLGGTIQQDIATELDKLEDSILPYLDKKRYMNKINELVQERLNKILTNFTIEDNYLWWRVRGEKTGMFLRVGDANNDGKIYLTFWSEFSTYRQYAPYRLKARGDWKDWIKGYRICYAFDYNLLRNGEAISPESLNRLASEIVRFYEDPIDGINKTIDEIIEECNPVIEK